MKEILKTRPIISKSILLSTLGILFLLSGCGSARRSEPLRVNLTMNEQVKRGQVVFMENCHKCHPGGEAGAGTARSTGGGRIVGGHGGRFAPRRGDRPDVLLVTHIEPEAQNAAALGVDFSTVAERRAAAEQAMRSGAPVAAHWMISSATRPTVSRSMP